MRLAVTMLSVLLAVPASACLNDRDTRRVQREAEPEDPMQGLPPIPNVLRGRFDKYPDLYYEMRRDRLVKSLSKNPEQLELYDDLAVAYDHLGDDASAIKWMNLKLELLETAEDKSTPLWKEHWYSYHANLGTFHAHHWIHDGASRENIDELLLAQDLITKAIEIKPDAHFGREKYQLMAIKWIASPPLITTTGELPNILGLRKDELDGLAGEDKLKAKGLWDAVQGLSGLIVLGAAWESVDVTYALGIALRVAGDPENAYAALLRCKELIKNGKRSFVPTAPTNERLSSMLEIVLTRPSDDELANAIILNYEMEREMAENWRRQRNDKITALLKTGRHPDTDFAFWAEIDGTSTLEQEVHPVHSDRWLWFGLLGMIAAAISAGLLTIVRNGNRQTQEYRHV